MRHINISQSAERAPAAPDPPRSLPALLRAARRTYTIDWQPSGITWHLDGALLAFQPAPVPSKPMYTFLSVWTKNSNDFGGVLTSFDHPPYHAFFAGVNRVVCDLDSPKVEPALTIRASKHACITCTDAH